MDQSFDFVRYHGIELLVYLPWWSAGVVHGMTTTEVSFKVDAFNREFAETIKAAFGVAHLALPKQCHGSTVLDLRSSSTLEAMLLRDGDLFKRQVGDAIAAPLFEDGCFKGVFYGVLTADCVPIIVRGSQGYVVIHAGWRGLAGGIIAAGLESIGIPQEAVIFACAGPRVYEVQIDVIEALGDYGVYRQINDRPGKYLLDTAATATKQLLALCPSLQVHSSGVCTIEDLRFHSYRRDGEGAGRSLTFIASEKKGGATRSPAQ